MNRLKKCESTQLQKKGKLSGEGKYHIAFNHINEVKN